MSKTTAEGGRPSVPLVWDDFARVLPDTAQADFGEELRIGGLVVSHLAHEYGTPLFIVCEQTFRDRLAQYRNAFGGGNVHYAAKAFLTRTLVPLLISEDVGMDCASGGELYTALAGGFPADRIVLHGNNKSDDEIRLAVESGVGRIVVDGHEELEALDRVAGSLGTQQAILVRITPGIEAHTHDYLKTGIEDTKFGVPIGDAGIEILRKANSATNLDVAGLHSHIGSQIFDLEPFGEAARVMVQFIARARDETGLELAELDLGGGLGIAYEASDEPRSVADLGKIVGEAVASEAEKAGTAVPTIKVEPGRSIVAPSMFTLYTSGVVKDIPGLRRYVSIDGGMSDNIRPMLYGARYTFLSASRPLAEHNVEYAVAGKLCENGDVLTRDAMLPELRQGELIAVAATGAYGYAMASNYNKQPKPAVIAVRDGEVTVLARRETYEDLVRLEQ